MTPRTLTAGESFFYACLAAVVMFWLVVVVMLGAEDVL